MKYLRFLFSGLFIWTCLVIAVHYQACQKPTPSTIDTKKQIIETLKKETQYFCERQLPQWQDQWSHQSFVSKMYAGNKAFEEFTSWEQINQYTVNHIAEFPEPIPIPKTSFEYDIHLFGETAWVFYSKMVDGVQVRETRFMVKEGEQWKIARMQTIF